MQNVGSFLYIIYRVKPSPLKVEQVGRDGAKKTRIKISFNEGQLQQPRIAINRSISMDNENDKNKDDFDQSVSTSRAMQVNESLTNLRQDISSLIEKSFGNKTANNMMTSGSRGQDDFEEDHEVSFGTGMNKLSLADNIFGTGNNDSNVTDLGFGKPIPSTSSQTNAAPLGMSLKQLFSFQIVQMTCSF